MLDFGFSEILLTSVIALVVLGPERLPKVARQVGNWMGRARAMARQLSDQLDREVTAEEFLKQQNARKVAPPKSIAPPEPAASPTSASTPSDPAATASGSPAAPTAAVPAAVGTDTSHSAAPPPND
jgi:sec-independent protein translocase protein TatB